MDVLLRGRSRDVYGAGLGRCFGSLRRDSGSREDPLKIWNPRTSLSYRCHLRPILYASRRASRIKTVSRQIVVLTALSAGSTMVTVAAKPSAAGRHDFSAVPTLKCGVCLA
jgi:hypothetical protein